LTPTTIVRSTLSRIRSYNPLLHSLTKVLPEFDAAMSARDSAVRYHNAQPLSKIDGIPVAVKDNFSTQSLVTTCGSGMLRDYKGAMDSTVVTLLEEAGAVVIGKANMDEFAMG